MKYRIFIRGYIEDKDILKPCREAFMENSSWYVEINDLNQFEEFIMKYSPIEINRSWLTFDRRREWANIIRQFGEECFSPSVLKSFYEKSNGYIDG